MSLNLGTDFSPPNQNFLTNLNLQLVKKKKQEPLGGTRKRDFAAVLAPADRRAEVQIRFRAVLSIFPGSGTHLAESDVDAVDLVELDVELLAQLKVGL